MSYADFLETKQREYANVGPTVDRSSVHPVLYEWQQEVVKWAVHKGRCAIFADCGLGKTFMQLEWARLIGARTLILAPLSVARQTEREARHIDIDLQYVRSQEEITGDGIWITNYEMIDNFDPSQFDAVVLDESSILKNVAGKLRTKLIEQFSTIPYRLACTATPAPNDVAELTNHSEFLGVLPRREMLAAFFIHDEDGWRLKGHASEPMFKWMATWALAMRRPSDLGYDDEGYILPKLHIHPEIVAMDGVEPEGQLFATTLSGIQGRSQVRRGTLENRVNRAVELVNSDSNQWIVWCGLNDEADSIAAQIPGAVNVHGSLTPLEKAQALEAFQDGTIRVLITKPKIAGFGMNFQNCSRMVFVGLSDSYESYYQSIRRCYRFGQTNEVHAHIVVSQLEQQIVNNVRRKETEAALVTSALVKQVHETQELIDV